MEKITKLDDNKFWPIILSLDIENFSDEFYTYLQDLLEKNFLIILKKQNLTIEKEIRFCEKIGIINELKNNLYDLDPNAVLHENNITYIQNIGFPSIDYRADEVDTYSFDERSSIVFMYGKNIKNFCQITFVNMALLYQYIPNLHDKCENIKIYTGTKQNGFFWEFSNLQKASSNLIYNKFDIKSLWFPFWGIINADYTTTNDDEWTHLYSSLLNDIINVDTGNGNHLFQYNFETDDIILYNQKRLLYRYHFNGDFNLHKIFIK